MIYKGISLWQPWASAIAIGLKKIETRSWRTNYLGPVAIHAAKLNTPEQRQFFEQLCAESVDIRNGFKAAKLDYASLPFGAVICVAKVMAVGDSWFFSHVSGTERRLGDYSEGRFCWVLEDVTPLKEPLPFKAKQGFFNVDIPETLLPSQ